MSQQAFERYVSDGMRGMGKPIEGDFTKVMEAQPPGQPALIAEVLRDPDAISLLRAVRLPPAEGVLSWFKPSQYVMSSTTVILLPRTARAWYIHADGTARSYRAELGFTLPSGEFHALAASNVVGTPRVGPAPRAATARVRYDRSGRHVSAAGKAALRAKRGKADPMVDTRVVGKPEPGEAALPLRGGASDTFRR